MTRAKNMQNRRIARALYRFRRLHHSAWAAFFALSVGSYGLNP
jgi:hypothetical protein